MNKKILFEQIDYLEYLLDDYEQAVNNFGVRNSLELKQAYATTLYNLWKLKTELFGGHRPAFPGGDGMAHFNAEHGGIKLLRKQIVFFKKTLEQKKESKQGAQISLKSNKNVNEIDLIEGIIKSLQKLEQIESKNYQNFSKQDNMDSINERIISALKIYGKKNYPEFRKEFENIHQIVKSNFESILSDIKNEDEGSPALKILGGLYTLMVDIYRNIDEDYLQEIASIGYLVLSINIESSTEQTAKLRNLLNRFYLENIAEKAFFHTVRECFYDYGTAFAAHSPTNNMPELYWIKLRFMQFADAYKLKPFHDKDYDLLNEKWQAYMQSLNQGYFNHLETEEEVGKKGLEYHDEVIKHLNHRFIERNNLSF